MTKNKVNKLRKSIYIYGEGQLALHKTWTVYCTSITTINKNPSISINYLRNEHDTDGDAGHEIGLQIFAPFVSSNPTVARQEQLNPVRPSHPVSPFPEIRRRRRGGWGGMLQLDDCNDTKVSNSSKENSNSNSTSNHMSIINNFM